MRTYDLSCSDACKWYQNVYAKCQVFPLRLTFCIPIVVIYGFADFRRNRLIPLLKFALRILTANLVRICQPRKPSNDKRKRRKRNIANPARTNVVISNPSWYRRTECSVLKPEHFSRGMQSCLQKNGRSPIQL